VNPTEAHGRHAAAIVRSSLPDLTNRQTAMLFMVAAGRQTIRGMAAELRLPKPSVTRAIDALVSLGLVQRRPDHADLRSVFVEIADGAAVYMAGLGGVLQ